MAFLTRRHVLAGGGALLASNAKVEDDKPLILMVGHARSEAWRTWQTTHGRAWMRTGNFFQVRFDTIDIPDHGHIMDSKMWPARYRWVVTSFVRPNIHAVLKNHEEPGHEWFIQRLGGPLHFWAAWRGNIYVELAKWSEAQWLIDQYILAAKANSTTIWPS